MSREPQTVVFRIPIDAAKQFRRSLLLVAANPDADHVPIFIAHRQFKYLLRCFYAKVAGCVENPEQRYAEIARSSGAPALQTLEDRSKVLLAVQANSDSDVDLGVQSVFLLQSLHKAIGDEFVILGAAQVCA